MKVIESPIDKSLDITMSKDEAIQGLLLSIMRFSNYKFLPYTIDWSNLILPDEIRLKLTYIPRGTYVSKVKSND